MITFAVLGLGNRGSVYSNYIAKNKDAKIVSVCDVRHESLKQAAELYGEEEKIQGLGTGRGVGEAEIAAPAVEKDAFGLIAANALPVCQDEDVLLPQAFGQKMGVERSQGPEAHNAHGLDRFHKTSLNEQKRRELRRFCNQHFTSHFRS